MIIIDCDLGEYKDFHESTSIALGNFDGLHRGHKYLVDNTIQRAEEKNCLSALLLFKNHTLTNIEHQCIPMLTSIKDKLDLLTQWGVDVVYLQTFDDAFRNVSKDDFLKRILCDSLNVINITVGHDYRFGKFAKGSVDDLIHHQEEYQYNVDVLEFIDFQGQKISSTRIKESLLKGNLEDANTMLGRPYAIRGKVINGESRGKDLGFPTANMKLDFDYIIPQRGVYLTRVFIEGFENYYYGMTNIGTNPTFTDRDKIKIETNIFDFEEKIYQQKMKLEFLAYERLDIKFDRPEDLIEQMKEDEKLLRSWIPNFEN